MIARAPRPAAAALVAVALCLAACQAGSGPGLGPLGLAGGGADPQLASAADDYRRTVREATILGAVAGAGIGAAVGAAGDGRQGALTGALAGAALGGILGNLAGTSVAETKRGYAAEEDRLDREIAAARAANAKLTRLVSVTRRLVAARRAEVARLRSAPAGDPSARRALLSRLAAERRTIDGAIASAEAQRDDLRATVAGYRGRSGAGALSAEERKAGTGIARLRADRAALDGLAGQLR